MTCPTCGRPGALPGALVCPACLAEIAMNCAPKDTRTIDALDRRMEARRLTETDLIGENSELRAERGDLRRERDNLLAENAALHAELDRLQDFLKRT